MSTQVIVLIVIGVVALLFILMYNSLVKLRMLVQEAWSGIEVFLKKRHDLIPNLVEIVKGYAEHEKSVFKEVTEARSKAISASTTEGKAEAEKALSHAMLHLNAVAESYPDLKANTNFLQLQSQLTEIEDNIESARRYYNGTVREQNTAIQTFPKNIVAGMFGFRTSPFFELENPAERAVPQVKF